MVHTVFFCQLILWKIISLFTRGRILWFKLTKFYFGWGSAPHSAGVPRPTGGIIAHSIIPLAGFEGFYFQGEKVDGRNRKSRGHLLLSNLTTSVIAQCTDCTQAWDRRCRHSYRWQTSMTRRRINRDRKYWRVTSWERGVWNRMSPCVL